MRTLNRKRPEAAARLAAFRKAAGLSQQELAEKLGVNPSVVAFWELHEKPPRSALLADLAMILNVSVEQLIGARPPRKRAPGPEGKAKKLFQQISALPRSQQRKILTVVEDMLIAQGVRAAK